jgi:hypothetical protein
MGVATAWHEATLRQLHDLLWADPAVELLAVVGSGAQDRLDAWSDLDVLLVVKPDALERFACSLAWIEPLGRIYASEHHRGEFSAVVRVCFEDLRRLDLIVTTEAALARRAARLSFPLADGSRVMFSRAPAAESVLARPHAPSPPHVPAQVFDDLVNGFWFKSVVAVQKVMRGDLLVALHLSLELIQECCVLAMMLRDREMGMSQHRGGVGNQAVAELEPTRRPHTGAGILDSIEQSGLAFDRLAARWSVAYWTHGRPLLAWIAAAREVLGDARHLTDRGSVAAETVQRDHQE